ncbi:hypothetical protein ABZ747_04135 [Kitasatospora cineracea]|uniref:hypothetical protein n=1 Tax=Kitasatospora cineracea TaxID=88074 RepID=UPI0033DC501D
MNMSLHLWRSMLCAVAFVAFLAAAAVSLAPTRSDSHSEAWTGIWMSGSQRTLSGTEV